MDAAQADPIAGDPDVVEWLAEQTGADSGTVAAELGVAAERRAFVVSELVEAGLRGQALLDGVMRLTGLSAEDARALIVAQAGE